MTAIVTQPSPDTIRITRDFAAPPAKVWRAFTTPDLIRQWMTGPMDDPMPVCELDPRPGGALRYVWRTEQGDMGLRGTIIEIEPEARIQHTESFDDWPDQHSTIETTFTPTDTGTRVVMTISYPSEEVRDMVAKTGMAQGVEASYARLDVRVLAA